MGLRPRSRRSLIRAVGSLSVAGLAGCTARGDRACRVGYDGLDAVSAAEQRQYSVTLAAGERLYLRVRRRQGSRPTATVFTPTDEPLFEAGRIERLERVFDIEEPGSYTVLIQNTSTASDAQWETTVAAYRGWCSEVF